MRPTRHKSAGGLFEFGLLCFVIVTLAHFIAHI
jgi:hypothetical protein